MKLWINISYTLVIIVGFIELILVSRNEVIATIPAICVFMILLGLNGFTHLRIAKLEEVIKEMKKDKEKMSI
jgi:hypothetical protein